VPGFSFFSSAEWLPGILSAGAKALMTVLRTPALTR
jgi:hypothetical protein